MRSDYLFTSESVSEGHPDKVADQISDAIVDLFLSKDPEARVACETLVTTQRIVVGGEIRCKAAYDEERFKETHGWAPGVRDEIEQVVRHTVQKIGYEQDGFHWEKAAFENHLHGQSAHIAQGVDESGNKDEGAGDQGIMFGYATDETPDLLPATLYYSHRILERLAADRHSGAAPFLQPDAKSQVTLRYKDGRPVQATALVVSTQHAPGYCDDGQEGADPAKYQQLRDYVVGVFRDVLPDGFLTDETKVYVKPAYVSRYLAKNIVAAGFAKRCTIQLSYAIGVAEPLSLYVDLHGTEANGVTAEQLEQVLPKLVRLTPKGIRTHLGLNKPIYSPTAAYGHFGRKAEGDLFTWEQTDLVDRLKAALA